MWPERDKFESNRTPKFLAWGTGDKVTSEVTFIVGLLSLESCLGRPMSRKSVLEELNLALLGGSGCHPLWFFRNNFFAMRNFEIRFREPMKHSFSHILVKNIVKIGYSAKKLFPVYLRALGEVDTTP